MSNGNKNVISVEAKVINCLIPLMASETMIFENLFTNLAFLLPRQSITFSGLHKLHMFGRGLLMEHFCKTFVIISAVR